MQKATEAKVRDSVISNHEFVAYDAEYIERKVNNNWFKKLGVGLSEKAEDIGHWFYIPKIDKRKREALEADFIAKWRSSKTYIKTWAKESVIPFATQELKHLNENIIMRFSKSTWGKTSAKIGFGLLGIYMVKGIWDRLHGDGQNHVQRRYKRGYHLLKEELTDFGSPVNLGKTASMVLMPYHSSTRSGMITTVRSTIESNQMLSTKAINHTRY